MELWISAVSTKLNQKKEKKAAKQLPIEKKYDILYNEIDNYLTFMENCLKQ